MGEDCLLLRRGVTTGESINPEDFPIRVETDLNVSATHDTRKKVVAERMAKFVEGKRSVHVPANPKDAIFLQWTPFLERIYMFSRSWTF